MIPWLPLLFERMSRNFLMCSAVSISSANHRDMCVLFRWACQDNFWSGNVLSPAKLRDKWTQLEINRNKQQAGVTASKPKLDLTNTDWIYGVDL